MDFDDLYGMVCREAEARGLAHKKMPKARGAVHGFELSNWKRSVYGNILASIRSGKQQQSITNALHDFYESHATNSYFIHIDTIGNRFLVIPYHILRESIYQKEERTSWSFRIRRIGSKYSLVKHEGGDIDLSKFVDDLDVLFEFLT